MMKTIDDAKKQFSVKLRVCAALGIEHNNYYGQHKSVQRIDAQREVLKEQTIANRKKVDACYGSRRMSAELSSRGFDLGRYKAHALMLECGMPKPPKNLKAGEKKVPLAPTLSNGSLTLRRITFGGLVI